jgi:hypothetical protein
MEQVLAEFTRFATVIGASGGVMENILKDAINTVAVLAAAFALVQQVDTWWRNRGNQPRLPPPRPHEE